MVDSPSLDLKIIAMMMDDDSADINDAVTVKANIDIKKVSAAIIGERGRK